MSHGIRFEVIDDLLQAARVLGSAGFLPATDGNLSARLDDKRVLISAAGVDKSQMQEADLIEVSIEDPQPASVSTEWPMHRTLYQRRRDVCCVLHVHSPALTAFASAHHSPRVELLAETFLTIGKIAFVPFTRPGTARVGESMLETDLNARVYLLANHGAVAVGANPREALHLLERAEFLAQVELNAIALGGACSLTREQLDTLS